MIAGRIINQKTNICLFSKVSKTHTIWERMRGLLGRHALDANQGLLIEPCPSVHTIGMRYPIDVVFLDRKGTVQKIVECLKPLRMTACKQAYSALELAAGQIHNKRITTGDILQWMSEHE